MNFQHTEPSTSSITEPETKSATNNEEKSDNISTEHSAGATEDFDMQVSNRLHIIWLFIYNRVTQKFV